MSERADQGGGSQHERADDAGRIASVYRVRAAELFRYAIMLTADAASAEDAIQQVFVKLLARNHAAGGSGEPAAANGPYLRRAVRNECYRILDRRRRAPAELNGQCILAPAGPGPADREEQALLERALRRLPPEQREVIHMKIYEQLTFQEIADHLGESINTIAGRYRYGLERLRQLLAGREEDLT